MVWDIRQDIYGLVQRRASGQNAPSGAVAQWLERTTHNRLVAGSIPACPTAAIR